ncbi:MAG: restriction endonuclease subunit S, partial [Oscillospiraceae bacterium]|nr:restriction endonuclease subunit S [Oscillospiraceae bacterium]
GFDGDWVERKLGDLLKVNSGRDYKHLNPGDIPVYGTGGYMLSVDESLSEYDAIGIGRKGTIDKPQLLKAPFWTVDTLFFMLPLPDNDLCFLHAVSQEIEWAKLDESTGVPSLSKTNIESIPRRVPTRAEQIAIGNFFRSLDGQITAQAQKVDQLQTLKKAYLQKMFI